MHDLLQRDAVITSLISHIKNKCCWRQSYKLKIALKPKKLKCAESRFCRTSILHVSTLRLDNTNKNETYLKENWDGWGSWAFPSHAANFGSTAYVWNLICKGLVHPLSVWELALRLWCCRLLRSFWKRRTYKQRLRTFTVYALKRICIMEFGKKKQRLKILIVIHALMQWSY